MESSELFVIQTVCWTQFGTLTFRGEKPEAIKLAMWFEYIRKIARHEGIHFHKLTWVLRTERGNLGRLHFHYLLDQVSAKMSHNFFNMGLWEGLGGGMARIYAYDRRQQGADYLLKSLGAETGYEVSRFTSSMWSELLFSNSFWKYGSHYRTFPDKKVPKEGK